MQSNSIDLFGNLPLKRCSNCKEDKPLSEFHHSHKNKGYPQLYAHSYCKKCNKAKCREHYSNNRAVYREANLKSRFGLTEEQYSEMHASQEGKCAVCGNIESLVRGHARKTCRLSVDHNHATKQVRGLLCNSCNRAIGLLQENPIFLRKAADYLDKFV